MSLTRKSCSNLADLLKSVSRNIPPTFADLLKCASRNTPHLCRFAQICHCRFAQFCWQKYPPPALQISSNLSKSASRDIYMNDLLPMRVTILFCCFAINPINFSPEQNIVDCLDKLSFTAVNFIKSENNLALL